MSELCKRIREADDIVKGTDFYYKYEMEVWFKRNGVNNWHFIGWGIPFSDDTVEIKKYRGKTYLYVKDSDGIMRYTVTDDVAELM